jgi:glycosyltransferase involved in cell wall biosynthesis
VAPRPRQFNYIELLCYGVVGVVLFLASEVASSCSFGREAAKAARGRVMVEASLVIPAHNEEHRLFDTLITYESAMRERFQGNFEIVVVANDCSDDTVGVANSLAASGLQIRTVEIEEAVGKGGAVLEGFRQVRGEAVAFVDADGATSPGSLMQLFEGLDRSDVVIGSRRLESSIIMQPQKLTRRFFGFMFGMTARLLFGMPYRDTQCGAKVLRREAARQLCDIVGETRWTFDLDLLLCARRLELKISEQPIAWTDKEGSHLRYASTSWEVLSALWGIKRRQRCTFEGLPQLPVLGEAQGEGVASARQVT